MDPLFTLNIDSINAAAINAQFDGTADLTLNAAGVQISMVSGIQYGPYTEYVPNPYYPSDPTTYPGGQVSIILNNQLCGPPTNQYQTVVYLDCNDNGDLNEAWAFNVSMTPAASPHIPQRGQFATFTAAYGSTTTTPSALDILTSAIGAGARIKILKKGVVNTWSFPNGQCFTINFNVQSN